MVSTTNAGAVLVGGCSSDVYGVIVSAALPATHLTSPF